MNSTLNYLSKGIKLFLLLLFSIPAFSQQPASPLEASFQNYRKMKAETPYKLDWITLGPVVNSARADVVQVDAKNPSTMYAGFGSGGLWKTTNNGITWKSIFEEQSAVACAHQAVGQVFCHARQLAAAAESAKEPASEP